MPKKTIQEQYIPLKAHFEGKSLTTEQFAMIEAVLHLVLTFADSPEPEKAYLMFSQYQLIGAKNNTEFDYIIQTARNTLGFYRSRKNWQDDLEVYRSVEFDGYRAFAFVAENEKTILIKNQDAYPYIYEKRQEEWEKHWSCGIPEKGAYPIATDGDYYYSVSSANDPKQYNRIKVSFSDIKDVTVSTRVHVVKEREHIYIKIADLIECAKEMAAIDPSDYCYTILQSNVIKVVNDSKVSVSDSITVDKVVNIVGMVGSGKSTLIKVLAFWANKNNKRITIVVDTVAEVFNLWQYLNRFHVNASPLVGRNERLKYINQIITPGRWSLPKDISQYLTNACLIDGMNGSVEESLTYGKEPCFSLKKSGKTYLCPFFHNCPGSKMLRDCYTSSVVITTVAGFAVSRVGEKRETFLNVAVNSFDIIIFDESDRVQKTLDQLFMPETSFDRYIQESSDDCHEYMNLSAADRSKDRVSQNYSEMQLSATKVMSCVQEALNRNLGKWNKLSCGEPFSALALLDDLKNDDKYSIPNKIYRDIYALIDIDNNHYNVSDTLKNVLAASCIADRALFNRTFDRWLSEEQEAFNREGRDFKYVYIQNSRIQLIICLIYFDHFIRELSNAYAASHETSYGQNEIFSFLQTRFKDQQLVLPSALCGNLFGMKKTEQGDIVLFRQFAFGRSLMKDLAYLRMDCDGNAIGPHVIMLSGSSFAEGSYEYHINRPVNYILEADEAKRNFLAKTKFYESYFSERVSGSGESRIEMLRKITAKSVEDIIAEHNRNAGKILIVVNSYDQAKIVQETLKKSLQKKQSTIMVCRMISDTVSVTDTEGCIRRGEVSKFAAMKEEILIAPAMAIERGHNIVDDTGHSALGAVFFFVRPMSVPDDIQEKGSKLNGYMETNFQKRDDESIWLYNSRLRQEATKRWSIITGCANYGLDTLSSEDQKDIVSTLFILVLQIFGRLARVTDTTKPEPHVYFTDGAFRKKENVESGFDCLTSLGVYLDNMMQDKRYAEIAQTLYKPFYEAYKKGIIYGNQ